MTILFPLVGGMVPLLMNFLGMFFIRRAGNDTQGAFRYRTYRSTRNLKTWKYAHKVCGKLWLYSGRSLLIGILPLSIIAFNCSEKTAGCMLSAVLTAEMLLCIGAVVFTEQALKLFIQKFSYDI